MKYNIQYLEDLLDEGKELKFIFFFRPTKYYKKVKESCLSQWYECEFTVDGVKYNTAEQYMMAQKAKLFGDENIFNKIMEASSANEFKALGKQVKGFDEKVWNENKTRIVFEGNVAKFSQNPMLKKYLLSTGDTVLVEASPYDKIWGIGTIAILSGPYATTDTSNWKGLNLLGFTLMEVRDYLKNKKR